MLCINSVQYVILNSFRLHLLSGQKNDPLSFQDHFEKGEHIIREGEEGNTFFIIAKGEVRYLHSHVKHALLKP